MLAVLSGGTGTPKLLQGLKEVVDPGEITVIVNTAEDKRLPFGYLSPDVDTVMYTLGGRINEDTWYGIKEDTFRTHETLGELGAKERFRIGDADRALKIQKGDLLKEGKKLSEAVALQCRGLGVSSRVYPMTDDGLEMRVKTVEGDMEFHEFLIDNGGRPGVLDIYFRGIEDAEPYGGVLESLEEAEGIIIGPSNPISSILPILSVRGIGKALRKRRRDCVAVSPIVGGRVVSGPAAKFMRARDMEVSACGVAGFYKEYAASFVIDELEERGTEDRIEKLGLRCLRTNTLMNDMESRKALAGFVIGALGGG